MRGDSLFTMDSFSDDPNDNGPLDDDFTPSSNTNSKADVRKSNKPIMEKRRRARINNCLNELKGILLEAMRKDPARHSKLEKADILELTVRHLQNIQRNQLAVAMATDPTVLYRFKNGFSECASEVGRYLSKMDGDEGLKGRVSSHLSSCVNGLQQVNPNPNPTPNPMMGGNATPGVGGGGGFGVRYGSDVPFIQFHTPPPSSATALIPPSNLTPPEDLNNNEKEPKVMVIHRPTPLNPVVALSAFSTIVKPPSSSPTTGPPQQQHRIPIPHPPPPPTKRTEETTNVNDPVDYSLATRQVKVLKVEPMTNANNTTPTSTKDSMWRPW